MSLVFLECASIVRPDTVDGVIVFVFATRFFDVFSASKQNPFVFFFAIVPRHFVIGKSPEGKKRLAWNPGKRSRISHLSEKEVHNGIRTLIRDYRFVKSSSGFLDLCRRRRGRT